MIIPKIGDEVWVAYRARGKAPPQKGVVSQIFDFEDRKTREMKTMVVVYRIARGQIGEKIFFSEDEAWEAYYKEMKRRGRIPYKREEKKVEKEKSPEGLELRLTTKGIAYYLACKHGLCQKVKGGYDTAKFDKFWNEFEAALLEEEQNKSNCGRQDSDDDGSNSNNIGDLRKAYASARKGVAIAGALFCIQLALFALQLILAFFLH